MEIQFGERVGHGGWLIGSKLFRPEPYPPTCVSSKLCEFIFREISRYIETEKNSTGVEQMDFTSFFRTSALTDGGFGSIFLFTIRATTLLYFLYNNHLHFCLYQAAAQKLAAKTIQTAKQTFPSTNCCFCVSFAVKK